MIIQILLNKEEVETLVNLISYAKQKLSKRLDTKFDKEMNLGTLCELHKRFRNASDKIFEKENLR